MAILPVPGAEEVQLVTQVGSRVVRGLQKASQPAPWPDTQEALLELMAILDEWCHRARETTRYAYHLASMRHPGNVHFAEVVQFLGNVTPHYAGSVRVDTREILKGRVPLLAKLRRSSRRRSERRGLRTILVTYCPDLLAQFEVATAARLDWVDKHNEDFSRWFDESRTDEEIIKLLIDMSVTENLLVEVTAKLRKFITTNFPLTNTPQGSDRR